MSKKFVFGIDLGTTYSCIAYVDDTGHAVVVPNGEGDAITPSVVQIDKDGSVVAGQVAKDNSIVEHASTVEFVKRQIGRTAVARTIHGTDYSPEEISAHILKKISVDVANSALGAEVKDVVITCPAYFGDAERLATANAGRIAGFNVMEVIKEPLAAAIYFGATKASENKTYMVFDSAAGPSTSPSCASAKIPSKRSAPMETTGWVGRTGTTSSSTTSSPSSPRRSAWRSTSALKRNRSCGWRPRRPRRTLRERHRRLSL